jgi:hypothetical protein
LSQTHEHVGLYDGIDRLVGLVVHRGDEHARQICSFFSTSSRGGCAGVSRHPQVVEDQGYVSLFALGRLFFSRFSRRRFSASVSFRGSSHMKLNCHTATIINPIAAPNPSNCIMSDSIADPYFILRSRTVVSRLW